MLNQSHLEMIVDESSLKEVLDALSKICFDKAEMWNKHGLGKKEQEIARAWFKVGNLLVAFTTNPYVNEISK